MSRLSGGLFSSPRGKMGGVVFGAARTRQGKVVTSRLLVSPSNPNTAGQQAQRSIFSYALDIVRRIGSGIYQTDWNRAIGQLPGFQSLQSIFMKQTSSTGDVTLITPVNLGTLEPLLNVSCSASSTSAINILYSAAVSGNGTSADAVKVICVAKDATSRLEAKGVTVDTSSTRDTEDITISGLVTNATYEIYLYAVGAGTASGLISVAEPYEVDLSA
jgi:hypothetical protein